MSEGEFYQGGMERFQREGYPSPRNVEFPGITFEKKLEQLRVSGDAEKIVEKYEFAKIVEKLLQTHPLGELHDAAFCEAFLFKYPEFSEYHPALVLAVAEEIEKRKNEDKKKLH